MTIANETGTSKFVQVECPDCSNRQIIFIKCATRVSCQACGSTLAVPSGGKGKIKGKIVGDVE
jgi:small subunit ribosomal protein S27e